MNTSHDNTDGNDFKPLPLPPPPPQTDAHLENRNTEERAMEQLLELWLKQYTEVTENAGKQSHCRLIRTVLKVMEARKLMLQGNFDEVIETIERLSQETDTEFICLLSKRAARKLAFTLKIERYFLFFLEGSSMAEAKEGETVQREQQQEKGLNDTTTLSKNNLRRAFHYFKTKVKPALKAWHACIRDTLSPKKAPDDKAFAWKTYFNQLNYFSAFLVCRNRSEVKMLLSASKALHDPEAIDQHIAGETQEQKQPSVCEERSTAVFLTESENVSDRIIALLQAFDTHLPTWCRFSDLGDSKLSGNLGLRFANLFQMLLSSEQVDPLKGLDTPASKATSEPEKKQVKSQEPVFQLCQTIFSHVDEIWCLKLSSCGNYLFSVSKDGTLIISQFTELSAKTVSSSSIFRVIFREKFKELVKTVSIDLYREHKAGFHRHAAKDMSEGSIDVTDSEYTHLMAAGTVGGSVYLLRFDFQVLLSNSKFTSPLSFAVSEEPKDGPENRRGSAGSKKNRGARTKRKKRQKSQTTDVPSGSSPSGTISNDKAARFIQLSERDSLEPSWFESFPKVPKSVVKKFCDIQSVHTHKDQVSCVQFLEINRFDDHLVVILSSCFDKSGSIVVSTINGEEIHKLNFRPVYDMKLLNSCAQCRQKSSRDYFLVSSGSDSPGCHLQVVTLTVKRKKRRASATTSQETQTTVSVPATANENNLANTAASEQHGRARRGNHTAAPGHMADTGRTAPLHETINDIRTMKQKYSIKLKVVETLPSSSWLQLISKPGSKIDGFMPSAYGHEEIHEGLYDQEPKTSYLASLTLQNLRSTISSFELTSCFCQPSITVACSVFGDGLYLFDSRGMLVEKCIGVVPRFNRLQPLCLQLPNTSSASLPRSSYIVCGSESGEVKFYEVGSSVVKHVRKQPIELISKQRDRQLDGHSARINALAWHEYSRVEPDIATAEGTCTVLFSAGDDATINVYAHLSPSASSSSNRSLENCSQFAQFLKDEFVAKYPASRLYDFQTMVNAPRSTSALAHINIQDPYRRTIASRRYALLFTREEADRVRSANAANNATESEEQSSGQPPRRSLTAQRLRSIVDFRDLNQLLSLAQQSSGILENVAEDEVTESEEQGRAGGQDTSASEGPAQSDTPAEEQTIMQTQSVDEAEEDESEDSDVSQLG